MIAVWLLCVAGLALLVVLALLLSRRTHDEVNDTIRSFDDFRAALSPGVSRLRSGTDHLGHRLDRPPTAPRG